MFALLFLCAAHEISTRTSVFTNVCNPLGIEDFHVEINHVLTVRPVNLNIIVLNINNQTMSKIIKNLKP